MNTLIIYPDLVIASAVRNRLVVCKAQQGLTTSDKVTNIFDSIQDGIYISIPKLLASQSSFIGLLPNIGLGLGNQIWQWDDYKRYFQKYPKTFKETDTQNGIYCVNVYEFYIFNSHLSIGEFTQKFCYNLLTQCDYTHSILTRVGLAYPR